MPCRPLVSVYLALPIQRCCPAWTARIVERRDWQNSILHFDAWSPRRNACKRRTGSPCWCLFPWNKDSVSVGCPFPLGWNARCHSLTGWRAWHLAWVQPLCFHAHQWDYSTVCCIPHSPVCPMTSLAYSRQTASDAPWWNLSRCSSSALVAENSTCHCQWQ